METGLDAMPRPGWRRPRARRVKTKMAMMEKSLLAPLEPRKRASANKAKGTNIVARNIVEEAMFD